MLSFTRTRLVWIFASVGAFAALVALAPGCSSSGAGPVDAGATADAVTPPPADGSADAPTPTPTPPGRYWAIKTLRLGDTDTNGNASASAWRSYGRDLDGLTSTAQSTDHCALASGAPNRVKVDGEGGIDNAFGASILPIFLTASPRFGTALDERVRAGGKTLVFRVDGSDPSSLAGAAMEAAEAPAAPKWDGTDERSVTFESLADGTLAGGAKARFSRVYERDGAIVAELPELVLTLDLEGTGLPLAISRATVVFAKPAVGATSISGTLSGVLPLDRFVADFRRVAGRVSTALCEPLTVDSIVQQFGLSTDIRDDLTNPPGAACNAISVGMGFVAVLIAEPKTAAPKALPPSDPCAK